MSKKPIMIACRFDQAPVIDFPESQTKRIRGSIAFSHRVSDFQGIAHDDQRFQTWQEVFPERQRQTIAGILPAPYLCRMKALDQEPRFHTQRIQPFVG